MAYGKLTLQPQLEHRHTGEPNQSGPLPGGPTFAAKPHTQLGRVVQQLMSDRTGGITDDGHAPMAGHAQEGGAVPDIDEGLTPLKLLADATGSAGGHSLTAVLKEQAQAMREEPWVVLRDGSVPHGAVDVAMSFGLTPPLLFLGFMGMKGGVGEIQEGLARKAALAKHLDEARKRVQALKSAMQTPHAPLDAGGAAAAEAPASPPALAQALLQQATEQVDELTFQQKINRLSITSGVGSVFAGAGIFINTAAEAVLTIALGIVAKGLNFAAGFVSPVLTMAGTAIGVAGTIVLGPLAALGGTILGSSLVRSTRATLARLRGDAERFAVRALRGDTTTADAKPGADVGPATIKTDTTADKASPLHAYLSFVGWKIGRHTKVLQRFRKWTTVFTVGSAVCLAAGTVKAAVAVCAIAGVSLGILAGPIGVGVLLLLVTAGGLTMLLGSHTFFFTLGKTRRYQGYEQSNHPEVDRTFMLLLDRLLTAAQSVTADGADRSPAAAGADGAMQMRATVFDSVQTRVRMLQMLLLAPACARHGLHHASRNKTYRDGIRQQDGAAQAGGIDKAAAAAWRTLRAVAGTVTAGLSYLGTLLRTLSTAQAAYARDRVKGIVSGQLTAPLLAEYLQGEYGDTAQRDWMKAELAARRTALQARQDCLQDTLRPMTTALPEQPLHEAITAALETDVTAQQVEAIDELLRRFNDVPDAQLRAELPALRAAFLALQRGDGLPARIAEGSSQPTSTATELDLARYCLDEALPGYTALRGTLLATELRVGRPVQA